MPSLEALLDAGFEVSGVVTNPDKPAGRGLEPRPSPVKQAALDAGLEVYQPPGARAPEVREWLSGKGPDAVVVVAYGKILPVELLEVPPLGFVNVHFSLLPAYRGAAPVQHALMDGVDVTGVTIMVLTEGMDEGPTLARETVAVDPDDNAAAVGEQLAVAGALLLVPTLAGYADGSLRPVEQDHAAATYAPKITAEDARIDWSLPAARIKNLVRALDPEPGAWTTLGQTRVKVFSVHPRGVASGGPQNSGVASGGPQNSGVASGGPQNSGPALPPGEVTVEAGELAAGTGDGSVVIAEAQLAGKRRMTGAEIARGLRLAPPGAKGTKFG